jgi:protein-disulfide isomerase
MKKTLKTTVFASAALLVGMMLLLPAVAEDADDVKARILANLKLKYPQLEEGATVGELTPSGFEGLDEGSLNMRGRPPQKFLVSHDGKKLWLVGEPVDVSRSQAEIEVALAERAKAKALEAEQRKVTLAKAIEGMPARGNQNASVTIVEFSDFQCPYCSRGADTMEQVLAKYPDDVKFVFKHFPLGFHNWAKPAAIATHCAAKQSDEAFWVLHDKYFSGQKQINVGNLIAKSKGFLGDAGIDMAQWSTCAEDESSAEYQAASAAVDADMELGKQLGVSGTAGFFVNGEFLNGAQPLTAFAPLIEKARM